MEKASLLKLVKALIAYMKNLIWYSMVFTFNNFEHFDTQVLNIFIVSNIAVLIKQFIKNKFHVTVLFCNLGNGYSVSKLRDSNKHWLRKGVYENISFRNIHVRGYSGKQSPFVLLSCKYLVFGCWIMTGNQK